MSEHADEARNARSPEPRGTSKDRGRGGVPAEDDVMSVLEEGGSDAEVRARWLAAGHAADDPRTAELEELLALRAELSLHGEDVQALLEEAALAEADEPGDQALVARALDSAREPSAEGSSEAGIRRATGVDAPASADAALPAGGGWHRGWLGLSLATAAAAVLLFFLDRRADEGGPDDRFGPMLGAEGLAAWRDLDAEAQLDDPIGTGADFGVFRWRRPAPVGGHYTLRVRDQQDRVLLEASGLEGLEWTPSSEQASGLPETIVWELVLEHPGIEDSVVWSGRATRE